MKRKFNSGKYYIGDPCYVVNDEDWDDLLEQTNYFSNEEQSYKGHNIFAGATAYGDGVYYDNEGRAYGVDSGNLGIVSFEAIDKKKYGKNLANVVNFKEDFETEITDGIFRFGSIIIYTDDETFDKCFDKFSENQFREFYDIFFDKFFSEQFDEFHDGFFDKIFDEFSCEFEHNVIDTCFDDYYNRNFDKYFNEYFIKNYNKSFDDYLDGYINKCFDEYYNKNFDSYFDNCFNQNFDEYYEEFINEVQVN